MWVPDLGDRGGPRYQALADALGEAVRAGELTPGVRLPTQRELADALGVTPGTVMRAYAEAARRGIVRGEVGRGTFVLGARGVPFFESEDRERPPDAADLSVNFLAPELLDPAARQLAITLAGLAGGPGLSDLLTYRESGGAPRIRAAAAAWLGQLGLEAVPDRVLACAGAQHGMSIAMAALCRAGDVVLTEALTYPGIRAIADVQQLRLRGVATDEDGLVPEAVEAACRATGARVLYCVPSVQNPTLSVASPQRRERLAEVARRNDLILVEDDVHGPLLDRRPPPLASLAPERTVHVTSLSKAVAPGLRVGFLHAPHRLVERLRTTLRTDQWMVPPLVTEIAARWMAEGTAEQLVAERRRRHAERAAIAEEVLGPLGATTHPACLMAWLPLGGGWTSSRFVDEARRRGVLVTGADAFVADGSHGAPAAVRLAMGQVGDVERLRAALGTVRDLAAAESCCPPPVV